MKKFFYIILIIVVCIFSLGVLNGVLDINTKPLQDIVVNDIIDPFESNYTHIPEDTTSFPDFDVGDSSYGDLYYCDIHDIYSSLECDVCMISCEHSESYIVGCYKQEKVYFPYSYKIHVFCTTCGIDEFVFASSLNCAALSGCSHFGGVGVETLFPF